jgi:hypothetical protein
VQLSTFRGPDTGWNGTTRSAGVDPKVPAVADITTGAREPAG